MTLAPAAVAMINNAAGCPPFQGDITSNPDTGERSPTTGTIPVFGISGTVTGTDGTHLIAADGGSEIGADEQLRSASPGYKTTTSFSSGGPAQSRLGTQAGRDRSGPERLLLAGVGTQARDSAVILGRLDGLPHDGRHRGARGKRVQNPTWDGLQIKAAIAELLGRPVH